MLGQRAEEAGRAGVWQDVGQAEVRWSGPVAWGVRSGLGRILGLGWVEGLGLGFYSSPLLFLIQTKFEFKYKFEFKPHSNIYNYAPA